MSHDPRNRHPFWRCTFSLFGALLLIGAALLSAQQRREGPGRPGEKSITVDGVERTYSVHVPRSHDGNKPVPLVLALHGGGGQGSGMDRLAHWNSAAGKHGFIVVYPDGLRRRWNDGRQSGFADSPRVDDVKFLSELIAQLSREYKIDPKRVYSTGISNGGFMSQRLACDLADKIAAIGVVAATMGEQLSRVCKSVQPVSVILIHGTEDPLVPYDGGRVNVPGGGAIISASAAVDFWVRFNGCKGDAARSQMPDKTEDGTQTQLLHYRDCKGGTDVKFYSVEGGGHTWPGGLGYLPERVIGRTSRDFNATEVIWEFFANHPRK
jgi:polyhydroxybutyrate depolymerase